MTWLVASVLFIIILLIVITWMATMMCCMGETIGRLHDDVYKSKSQMNSVICQLTERQIQIKGLWSDTVTLEDEQNASS